MASSLIRINEATANRLIALPGINTTRARRIVRFRTRVGELRGLPDMVFATGLAPERLAHLVPLIDWSAKDPAKPYARPDYLLPACLGVAILVLALLVSGVDGDSSASQLAMAAGFSIAFAIASVPAFLSNTPVGLWLRQFASAALIAGCLLFLALVIVASLIPDGGEPLRHIVSTFWFLLLFSVIGVVIFGPQLLVDFMPRLVPIAHRSYDYLRLSLLPISLVPIIINASTSRLDEIFGLWAAIILFYGALEIYRGENTFVASLSDRHRAKMKFLVDLGDIRLSSATPSRPLTLLLSAGAAIGLSFVSLRGLLDL